MKKSEEKSNEPFSDDCGRRKKIAESLCTYLEGAGIETVDFRGPITAIEFFNKNFGDIRLIVTDFNMKESLNGLDMIKRMHFIKPVPYILVSGSLAMVEAPYDKHQVARLDKPYDIPSLESYISLLKATS